MRITTMLGFMAAILTTISFLPQVLRTWRRKHGDDLSWSMLLTFSAGVVLWMIYGILLRSAPIVVANAVTLVFLIAIIYLKMRYRAR